MKRNRFGIECPYSKELFYFPLENSFQPSPPNTHVFFFNIHVSLQQPEANTLISAIQLKPGKAKTKQPPLQPRTHLVVFLTFSNTTITARGTLYRRKRACSSPCLWNVRKRAGRGYTSVQVKRKYKEMARGPFISL